MSRLRTWAERERFGLPIWIWGIVVAILGGIAGLLAVRPMFFDATRIHGAELVGDDLFVLYGVGAFSNEDRFKIFDLATGQAKVSERLTSWSGYLSYSMIGPRAHSEELWLHSKDLGVHARNAHTGRVVLRETDLIAKHPELAPGFRSAHSNPYYRLDAETGDLCLETVDRFVFRLDAATGASQKLAPTDPGCAPRPSGSTTESMFELSKDRWLLFEGSPRAQIGLRTGGKTRLPDPANSYAEPEWLCGGQERRPLRIGSGPDADAVLVHLVDGGTHRAVSRVAVLDGKPRWTSTLVGPPNSALRGAWIAGDRLVILALGEVAAFDLEGGARRFSARF
jgi:hypothetical protein